MGGADIRPEAVQGTWIGLGKGGGAVSPSTGGQI